MADKINVEINRYNGTDYDQLLPSTSINQVDELQAALDAKQPALTAGQNIAITGNTIGTKAFPCNPNLLDNWYFGNPVNQRGQTSYGKNSSYTIDRWGMRGDNATVSIEDGGIVIGTDGGTFNSLIQSIENGTKNLAGQTVTFSVLVAENTQTANISYLAVGNASSAIAAGLELSERIMFGGTGLKSITVTLPTSFTYDKLNFIICAGNPSEANKRFKILAVKLELGTEQTLAHQDANGNWVLNEIPDYGEQLRRCQRYCIRLNLDLMPATIIGSTNIVFFVPLPVTMRTVPAIATNNFLVRATVGGANQTDFTFAASSLRNNGVIITATKTNHGLTGASLSAGTSGSLLSADL